MIKRNKKDKKTKNERKITMKVKRKTDWRGEKFIIRLARMEGRECLSSILSSLANLSKSPYYDRSFDYICKMVSAAEKLFTALSNIGKIIRGDPSCRYLSQEEKERLQAQKDKIKALLKEVLSKLQEMVKTTPEDVPETLTKPPSPEAEAQKPEASASPKE